MIYIDAVPNSLKHEVYLNNNRLLKKSVPASENTKRNSSINWSALFREMIPAYSENYTKLIKYSLWAKYRVIES
jgi:hypothetical protein